MYPNPFARLLRWPRSLLTLVVALLIVLMGLQEGLLFSQPAPAVATMPSGNQSHNEQQLAEATTGPALLQLGQDYYNAGYFNDAENAWSQAEQYFTTKGDTLQQAIALSNRALAYRQQGHIEDGITIAQASVDLLEAVEALSPEGFRIYGQALNTQGSLYMTQGQNKDAWQAWKKATEQYQRGDYTEGVVKSLLNQAQALRSLGFFRRSSDRIADAQDILLNHELEPTLKAELYLSMGKTQRLLGNLDESNKSLQKAEYMGREPSGINSSLCNLDEPQQINDSLPDKRLLGRILLSQGINQQTLAKSEATLAERTGKEREQEKDCYEKALKTYRKISSIAASQITKIHARLNQLAIYIDRRQWQTVETHSADLIDDINTLPLGRSSSFAQLTLAHLMLDVMEEVMEYQCDPETDCTAIQNLQKSVPRQAYNLLATVQQQTSRDNDPIVQSYALGYLGHLYELSGKTNESQRLTQEALTLTSRSNIVYQWQWQLGRLTNHPNTQESSLEYYKNAVENVKTVREDLLYVSPDARFDFRDRIEPLYRQYISLLLSSNSSSAHAKSTTDEIQDALLKEAQEVIDSLRVAELENFLACGLLEANSTDLLASIQEVADAEQHTAIIYPIILDDRLEILTRLPGQVAQSKKLDQPKPQIEHNTFSWSADQAGIVDHKLKQFRKELERPYFSNEHGQPLAEEIYDWLIRPIEDVLAQNQIDTLVFVLDGAFRNVPMAALSDGEQFLVEKYAIAATFGDLKIPEDPRQKTFRLLAAGLSADPKSPQTKISEEESPPDIFGPLFFVDEEINKIKQKFPTIALQNSDFTKEQVQKNIRLSAHNVVHLATHGEFGFTRDQTYLLAAADNSITELDQPIETEKIDLNNFDTLLKTRNQMPLDLLVLSACETATGDDREVLGIAGLAIQSGARSTLATLWSISDASTAILMDKFYDQLLTGVSKAKALQQAQKYLLKAGDKPSKWAPYLLVGDWR